LFVRRTITGYSGGMTASDAQESLSQRPTEFVQSLERGLAVIRAFSRERPRLTLSDVARQTGMTRAAARRFLITLESLGYVSSDGRLFSLRPSVMQLGYAYLSSFSLAEVAQDQLEALADELHESCSASVLDDLDIVYVARASTNRIMTIGLSVGARLPAHCTSMGRVMLGALSDQAIDAYLARAHLEARTVHTITDPEQLRTEIFQVRAQGWCLLDQELESGVRSVAVAVHDATGRVAAAINTSAHAARVSRETLHDEFLPKLQECARHIDQGLAGHSH
jgi:IclR family pca regulon transcriptional regulator